jgi:hypothetical protein
MFTGLPHKVLEPAQFSNSVEELKKRFVDPKNPEFILHTEHFQKDIPADGLAPYASRIWVIFFPAPHHRIYFFSAPHYNIYIFPKYFPHPTNSP